MQNPYWIAVARLHIHKHFCRTVRAELEREGLMEPRSVFRSVVFAQTDRPSYWPSRRPARTAVTLRSRL